MNEADELRAAAGDAVAAVARLSDLLTAHLAAEVDIEFPPVDPPPAPAPAPEPSPPPPAPAPEPAPAPAPEPAPPPPPPPPKPAPEISIRQITGSLAICCAGWNSGGATYDRFQTLVEWVGGKGMLKIWRTPLGAGPWVFPTRTYTVTVSGIAVAEVAFREGSLWADVTFDSSALPDGWVRLACTGLAENEWAPEEWAYNRLTDAVNTTMPLYEDSHKRPENPTHGEQAMCWVPAVYAPKAVPLALREFKPVTATTPVRAQVLTRMENSVNPYTTNTSKNGTVSGFSLQAYFWTSMLERYPPVPLLDGPRGVGTLPLVAHIEVGLAAPDGVPRHTYYCATSWGGVRGRPDGSTKTLFGWRHNGMASYHGDGKDQRTLELVGDWSAVPADRRGPWAIRSFCWDQASLAVDESLPRIPGEDGAPHPTGPVMYVAEQRESCRADVPAGRILRVEFSAKAHDIPPIVTEFVTGLRGVWGVVDWGDKIIASERNASRIIAIDKATKAITVLIAADPALPGRVVVANNGHMALPVANDSTLEQRREQPCMGPEDLKIQDGWLYFSSFSAQCIKRYSLAAMQLDDTYLFPVELDRQSWAVKFALSDGTFADRGAIFYNTWGQVHHAAGAGHLAGGRRFTAHAGAAPWGASGYPFAIAVGDNRMYFAASNIGVTRYSAALRGELPINAALYRQGQRDYDALHGDLRWGPCGFGDRGHDLPWGTSAALDYYLTMHDLPR